MKTGDMIVANHGTGFGSGCGGQPLVLRFWNCTADYANEAERCADRRVAESIAEDETPPIGGIVDVTHAHTN